MSENKRIRARSTTKGEDYLAGFDLSLFSAREVAHLLAQRILFRLGQYGEDDPFGNATQSSGDAKR